MAERAGFDAAVVGAGVMGSATAWRLAGRGKRVVLFEQFEVGHARGSSHGSARIFRFSYDHPMYVKMAMEALPMWREIEEESSRALLTTTGGLDIGPQPNLDANAAALATHGARFEFLTGGEAMARFPALSIPPDAPVLFQPDAGVVAAEAAVEAFVDRSVACGVELREGTPVSSLRPAGEWVEVVTVEGETVTVPVVVVTAGAWAKGLVAGAEIDLPVTSTRETVAFFRIEPGAGLPTFVDWGDPLTYSLPSPGQGVKVGMHRTGPTTDPDRPGPIDERAVSRMAAWAAHYYPTADRQAHHAETCLYTSTQDEDFILERHGPIVVGSPCSGHGFKFAPLIGERLAELAAGSMS